MRLSVHQFDNRTISASDRRSNIVSGVYITSLASRRQRRHARQLVASRRTAADPHPRLYTNPRSHGHVPVQAAVSPQRVVRRRLGPRDQARADPAQGLQPGCGGLSHHCRGGDRARRCVLASPGAAVDGQAARRRCGVRLPRAGLQQPGPLRAHALAGDHQSLRVRAQFSGGREASLCVDLAGRPGAGRHPPDSRPALGARSGLGRRWPPSMPSATTGWCWTT